MKKVVIICVSVVLLLVAHGTYWFYSAGKIKESIEFTTTQISKTLGRQNTEFFFENSKISGYPFNFTVNLNNPKFISTGSGETVEVTLRDDDLVILSNLIGNNYKIKLPQNIYIKHVAEGQELEYHLQFKADNAQFNADFASNIMLKNLEDENILLHLQNNLKYFSYYSEGYELKHINADIVIASSNGDNIKVTKTHGSANTVSTMYEINLKDMSGQSMLITQQMKQATTQEDIGVWPISAVLDFSTIDAKNDRGQISSIDLIIRNIDIKAASFAFNVKGNVKADGSDVFPFGDLSLQISNYKNMVDYLQDSVGNVIAASKIPLFRVKNDKNMDFKKVLYDIASERSNDGADILLTIEREAGKSLFIGQKGLMEVIDLLKASATDQPDNVKIQESGIIEENTQPNNKDIRDISPSTGDTNK